MNAIAIPDPSQFLLQMIRSTGEATHSSKGQKVDERSLRILAVDDEASILEVLGMYLELEGHTLETASNGADGLNQFRKGGWDLVMVDCCMPGMSGVELAAAIKESAPHVPVMMVTGSTDVADGEECASISVDSVVKKPFTRASLLGGIDRALARCGKQIG